MRRFLPVWLVSALVLSACGTISGTAKPDTSAKVTVPTMIVLDASGSMLQSDARGTRIDAAKTAVNALVDELPADSPVGLIVYGTGTGNSDAEEQAGCRDIKTLIPVGPLDRDRFKSAVNSITASGYTPISSAIDAATAALPKTGKRSIVIVSDGEDTCAPPTPCATAQAVHGADPDLTIHTVGFRAAANVYRELNCVANATGGLFIDATNADQLKRRLALALNPSRAQGTLEPASFHGVRIGMTVDEATAAATASGKDLTGAGTDVVVEWRDCRLTFTNGHLTSIEPKDNVPTLDGVAPGDDVTKALDYYGPPTVESMAGQMKATFIADRLAGTGYEVHFTPAPDSSPDHPRGKIVKIILCQCLPISAMDPCTDASATCDVVAEADIDGDGWLEPIGVEVGSSTMTLRVSFAAGVKTLTVPATPLVGTLMTPAGAFVGAFRITRATGADVVLNTRRPAGASALYHVIGYQNGLVDIPRPAYDTYPTRSDPTAWTALGEFGRTFFSCTAVGAVDAIVYLYENPGPASTISKTTTSFTYSAGRWTQTSRNREVLSEFPASLSDNTFGCLALHGPPPDFVTVSASETKAPLVATFTGFGPILIGMTLDQARAAVAAAGLAVQDHQYYDCTVMTTTQFGVNYQYLSVWTKDQTGKVTGIDTPLNSRSDRGIGTGSTIDEVRAAYPASDFIIETGPIGGQGAPTVKVRPRSSTHFLMFEVGDDGLLYAPSIDRGRTMEGC